MEPLPEAARRDIIKELRQHVHAFDNLSYAEQQSLIETHVKTRNASATANIQPPPPTEIIPNPMAVAPLAVGPTADEAELRAKLRDCIERYQAALSAFVNARVLAEQANARERECAAAVARFDGLDDRVAVADVDAMRSGDHAALPYELSRALKDRDKCRDQWERGQRAAGKVRDELAVAEQAFNTAATDRLHAIGAICVLESWRLVKELDYAEALVHHLRCAIVSLQLPNQNLPVALVARATQPLKPTVADPASKREWADHIDKLRRNANAEAVIGCGGYGIDPPHDDDAADLDYVH